MARAGLVAPGPSAEGADGGVGEPDLPAGHAFGPHVRLEQAVGLAPRELAILAAGTVEPVVDERGDHAQVRGRDQRPDDARHARRVEAEPRRDPDGPTQLLDLVGARRLKDEAGAEPAHIGTRKAVTLDADLATRVGRGPLGERERVHDGWPAQVDRRLERVASGHLGSVVAHSYLVQLRGELWTGSSEQSTCRPPWSLPCAVLLPG